MPETPKETTEISNGAPKEAPKKKSNKKLIITLVSVFSAIILIGSGIVGGVYVGRMYGPNASPSLSTSSDGNKTITEEESSIAAVAEKVGPSVVSIVTQTRTSSYFGGTSSSEAAGTGIIVSDDGYVITNNHVIDGATSINIVDSTGKEYTDVKLIGRDPLNDIAFLKINSDTTFTAAELGNSSTVRTGQQVVAIGNALGQYSNTVTSGIISGTGRLVTASSENGSSESLTDLIQTDASINPGNSGGPLVNMSGQVIGINTAIAEDANGIGFSIPINSTKGILAGVLENGTISRAYLGISYIAVTPEVAREYKLDVDAGAYIHTSDNSGAVASGSPASKAGLKDGDIITKINDETIGSEGSLSSILGEYRPGDKITITYLRDGDERTVTLSLGEYSD